MWFRVRNYLPILILFLLWKESNAAIPQIVQSIVTETKPIKGTAYLNCTVAKMNSGAPVKWIKMNGNVALTDDLKVTTVNDRGRYDIIKSLGRSNVIPVMPDSAMRLETYTLIIKDLRRDDGGKYKCMVDQSGLDASKKPFAIGTLVVQSPARIMPGPLLVPQVVNEFGTLKLECKARGSPTPTISWTRANGKPLNVPPPMGQTQKPHRVYGKVLTIYNMTRADRGIYRCHAQNNVDKSDEYDVVVEVNFPPKASVARLDGYYAQSPDGTYQVAIECIASGYPSPEVRFYYGYYDPPRLNPPEIKDEPFIDIEKLYSYGAAGLSFDETLYEMRIQNVKSNAYGIYTCLAVNEFGTSNATLSLNYQPICQGPLCFLSQYRPSSATLIRPSLWLCVALFLFASFRPR